MSKRVLSVPASPMILRKYSNDEDAREFSSKRVAQIENKIPTRFDQLKLDEKVERILKKYND